MPLKDIFKLEKVQIQAYKKRGRDLGDVVNTVPFEVMFNPESVKQKYEIEYAALQPPASSGKAAEFTRSLPRLLNMQLIFDGTGVTEFGLIPLQGAKAVQDRIKEFLNLTHTLNGKVHEPSNFLKLTWGKMKWGTMVAGQDEVFKCRLVSAEIDYQRFDRDGTPLRAVMDVQFVSDEAATERKAQDNPTSPDLTHTRIVKNGDTLPLLTKDIYGSSAHYVRVAEFNNLDDFRHLTPGQALFFPPLERPTRR